jgi:cellulose synthase/poly-beta-1,6-N-acetylglucosamine synthase-like glycosyltransferase
MFQDNPFLMIVFILFALSAAIQLFYYLYLYLAVPLYKHPDEGEVTENKPVSVIICARNESVNLRNLLPAVLEQDHPGYEVIVVNDCSEDDSYNVLGEYLLKYPHLRISNVNKDPQFTHNKKFAQFIGIKASVNDILVFTDADCRPESRNWLSGMTSHFKPETDFVLGYGGYIRTKGFLNSYIRYDTMTIGLQYLGMAIRGIPYMGVGRNLAYRRRVFFDNKGFGSHSHIISGDDDLFVNSNAGRTNTSVEFRTDNHTRSVPAASVEEWVKQKKRHLRSARYYKARDIFLLATEPFTRIMFYASFIVLMANLFLWPYTLAIFGLRLIAFMFVIIWGQKALNERGLVFYSVFFDIFSPLINSIIYLSNTLSKSTKNQWK